MEIFAKLNLLSPFPLRRFAVTVTIVFYAGDKESVVTHVTDSRSGLKKPFPQKMVCENKLAFSTFKDLLSVAGK